MNWVARCVCVLWALGLWQTRALQPPEYTLLLSAQADFNPPKITIRWPVNPQAREIIVRRKSRESTDWGAPIATLAGNATQLVDSNVAAGQAYEYEFTTRAGDGWDAPMAYGYICAGVGVGIPDGRGKVILVVDASHATALGNELEGLRRNLIGDGWMVIRRDVWPSDPVSQVRGIIQAEYNADPNNVKAVFLFGHVPVPYSGVIYPDLHMSHRGAWPADVFYGEMNGAWTDNSAWHTSTEEDVNKNVPNDGKFDQSVIPTAVELEVGRVDFWNLPAFAPRTERELLRSYLLKNHRFRQRDFTLQGRGLIRDEFGVISGDAPAVDAWRAFPALFGLSGITAVNSGQFLNTLRNDSFLFAYGGGGGSYDQANGVATTGEFAANDPRCAFFMLHGSYFGDWNTENNLLRAAIATPSFSLVSVWTSLPHWFFHRMALGESVGSVVKLMQNDRARIYKTDWDWAVGEVHMSMMGDPTLRMHFVAPPRNVRATPNVSMLALTWDAAPETVTGYHVYRADSLEGPYTRLNRALVTEARFDAPMPAAGRHFYMVRAQNLQTSGSGSFHNLSQGAFVEYNREAPPLPEVTVRATVTETAENGGPLVFEFTRARNLEAALTVNFQMAGSATPGQDFPLQPGSVNFAAGIATATLSVQPLQDAIAEFNETIVVTIGATESYTVGTPHSATGIVRGSGESRITNARLTATGLAFDIVGFASRPYRVESRPPGGVWRERKTGVAPANGLVTYAEASAPAGVAEMYRVIWE